MEEYKFIGFAMMTLSSSIAIFFLLRPLLHWYWKVDEQIYLQKQILDELKKLNQK